MKVNLKNVRVIWVDAFEKSKDGVGDDGKPVKGKYRATVLLNSDDPQIEKLEDAAFTIIAEGLKSEAAAEKWMKRNYGFGNHTKECAVRDLAEREKPIEGHDEGLYMVTSSQKKPLIVTSLGEKQVERGLTIDGDDIEGEEIFSGCYANVSLDVYWNAKYKLLSIGLLGLRYKSEGEAFGGSGEQASADDLDDDDEKPVKKSPRRSTEEDDDGAEEQPRRRSRR